ncbi:MAG: hypothetical protein ACP5D2_02245 [Candidatus Nanoarchaeia archaeon]
MKKRFKKIIKKIKTLEVQGAEDVAKTGIKAFLIEPNKQAAKILLKSRPTEPLLQNAIKRLLKAENKKREANKILREIEKAHKQAVSKGKKLIKNNMNIYTHCHSSTVIDILKQAKQISKKRFVVYTTEVEPRLQGRMTARELSNAHIKTIIAPDLAAEHIIRKCDLFLFGADAFTKKGVVNKIGTSFLCELAKKYHIPRYSCGISMKYANKVKLEKRPGKEVWDDGDKLIDIENPAFDFVNKKLLTGIISEHGILTYKQFLKKVK